MTKVDGLEIKSYISNGSTFSSLDHGCFDSGKFGLDLATSFQYLKFPWIRKMEVVDREPMPFKHFGTTIFRIDVP